MYRGGICRLFTSMAHQPFEAFIGKLTGGFQLPFQLVQGKDLNDPGHDEQDVNRGRERDGDLVGQGRDNRADTRGQANGEHRQVAPGSKVDHALYCSEG